MAFYYQYPTDNITYAATITSSGSPSDYPVGHLWDGAPGSPAKLSATSGWFKLDFGGAQVIKFVSLIHSNLAAGLTNVNIQGNSSDSFGSPPFNQSFTIPTWRLNGLPGNPWLDLSTLPGYNPAGYRWWRINFGTANTANVSLGELWMSTIIREYPFGIQRGAKRGWKFNNSIDSTEAGQTIGYEIAPVQRRIDFSIDYLSMTAPEKLVRDAIHEWVEVCRGGLRPFLIVPDSTVNESMLVKGEEEEPSYNTSSFGKHDLSLQMLEVGRGVIP